MYKTNLNHVASPRNLVMISTVKTKVVVIFETLEVMCVDFMRGQKAIIIVIQVANFHETIWL